MNRNKPIEVKDGKVVESLRTSIEYSLEGPLHKVITALQRMSKEYPGYSELTLDRVPAEYLDGYNTVLTGTRKATSEECEAWKVYQAAEKKRQEEWDLRQLEVLKKKYEKENTK